MAKRIVDEHEVTSNAANEVLEKAGGKQANGQPKPEPKPLEPVEWEPFVPLVDLPNVEPFPVEIFPPQVKDFAEECAWATSSPIDFAAVPILTAAGAAIGNSFRLAITRTHTQSACLFTCIIGRPGTRKSPILELIKEPFEEVEHVNFTEFEADHERWKESGESGNRPKLKRCLVDDFTTEDLVRVLSENPRGVFAVKDELSALVSALNQYKTQGRGADRQIILQLWAGASIRVDRKSNKGGIPLRVRRPFTAITGGIQPDKVDRLRGEAERHGSPPDDGFLDRFLPAYPLRIKAERESWRDVSPEAMKRWGSIVKGLMGSELTLDGNAPKPFHLPLSSCGKQAWEDFTQVQADELNSDDMPTFLEGPWSKLTGCCGRIALILHLLREQCGEEVGYAVDGESLRRAMRLVKYFKDHIRKVATAMSIDPLAASSRLILGWIARERRKEFKRWEAYHDLKHNPAFFEIDNLDRPLEQLMKHCYLRVKPQPKRDGPGRPAATVYEVNDTWDFLV